MYIFRPIVLSKLQEERFIKLTSFIYIYICFLGLPRMETPIPLFALRPGDASKLEFLETATTKEEEE